MHIFLITLTAYAQRDPRVEGVVARQRGAAPVGALVPGRHPPDPQTAVIGHRDALPGRGGGLGRGDLLSVFHPRRENRCLVTDGVTRKCGDVARCRHQGRFGGVTIRNCRLKKTKTESVSNKLTCVTWLRAAIV